MSNNKSMTLSQVEQNMQRTADTLAMQSTLRQAIFNSITEDDIAELVKRQVDKAKSGDEKSLQFVMKYVLGYGQPITLQQINVTDVETAARMVRGK